MSTVFFDVDTQFDFLVPAGALYVPGAERIVANLERLTRYAAHHGVPLISTLDTHGENDPEFPRYLFHPHCIEGTLGHAKPPATLGHPAQHFLRKATFDCFTNPELKPLLGRLDARTCVVYGVVTEICVQCAAEGLQRTGARVLLVVDAIQSLDAAKAAAFFDAFSARGGKLVTAAEVCA